MRNGFSLLRSVAFLAAGSFFSLAPSASAGPHVAAPPEYAGKIFPPWSHGANDPTTYNGLEFTVPEVNDMPDFHGNVNDPKLVLYVAGNYYFAMAPLVAAFQRVHPEYAGRIFYVTIPPGYGAALVKGAPHPRAGQAWIAFLQSPAALHIFERYGFKPAAHKAKV